MKRRNMILMILAVFMLSIPMLLLANSNKEINLVQKVQELDDDSKVVLQGYITDKLDNETFLFRDGTGQVLVIIESKVSEDKDLNPEKLVRLHGKVVREYNTTKVRVNEIKNTKIEIAEADKEEQKDEEENNDNFGDAIQEELGW